MILLSINSGDKDCFVPSRHIGHQLQVRTARVLNPAPVAQRPLPIVGENLAERTVNERFQPDTWGPCKKTPLLF